VVLLFTVVRVLKLKIDKRNFFIESTKNKDAQEDRQKKQRLPMCSPRPEKRMISLCELSDLDEQQHTNG
jgi:hypothetical protein